MMATQPDLFEVGHRIKTKMPHTLCVPAALGTGPVNETCGSCVHKTSTGHTRRYLKCGLMRAYWTHGPGTDIKARWKACAKWEPQT